MSKCRLDIDSGHWLRRSRNLGHIFIWFGACRQDPEFAFSFHILISLGFKVNLQIMSVLTLVHTALVYDAYLLRTWLFHGNPQPVPVNKSLSVTSMSAPRSSVRYEPLTEKALRYGRSETRWRCAKWDLCVLRIPHFGHIIAAFQLFSKKHRLVQSIPYTLTNELLVICMNTSSPAESLAPLFGTPGGDCGNRGDAIRCAYKYVYRWEEKTLMQHHPNKFTPFCMSRQPYAWWS